jgi:5-methylcytosine-specific restriction endonuclease McrA
MPGPKKGYKQSPEHIAKRTRWGSEHHAWKGENVSNRAAHHRAETRFKNLPPCEDCGNVVSERHHADGNPLNNMASNIKFLCRKCHMSKDGRLEKLKAMIPIVQPMGVAARWGKSI